MRKRIASAPVLGKPRLRFLGVTLVVVVLSGNTLAADFEIEVTGFSDGIGQAVVRLYASPEHFAADTPDTVVTAPIAARKASVRLPALNGTYVLSVHHDRDGDGLPNKTPFGLPLEPVGYSQDAWNGVSRPGWAVAAFSSDIVPAKQTIRLRTNAVVAFAQMSAVGLPALVIVFAGLAVVRWIRAFFNSPGSANEISHDRQD